MQHQLEQTARTSYKDIRKFPSFYVRSENKNSVIPHRLSMCKKCRGKKKRALKKKNKKKLPLSALHFTPLSVTSRAP